MKGRIKWFNHITGYGFIISEDETLGDIFLHAKRISEPAQCRMWPGTEIEFDIVPKGEEGWEAVNVIVETRFEKWRLPEPCSHVYAVKDTLTNRIQVFQSQDEIRQWMAECMNADGKL